MNPVFWFLVLVGIFVVWVICCSMFPAIGGFLKQIAKSFEENINKDDEGDDFTDDNQG